MNFELGSICKNANNPFSYENVLFFIFSSVVINVAPIKSKAREAGFLDPPSPKATEGRSEIHFYFKKILRGCTRVLPRNIFLK